MDQPISQANPVSTPPLIKKQYNPKYRFFTHIILASLLLSIIAVFLIVSDRVSLLIKPKINTPIVSVTPTPYVPPPARHWVLKKASESGNIKILTLSNDTDQALFWGGIFFYTSDNSENARIDSYNFQTEKSEVIYDITQRKDFSDSRSGSRYISDMQVIDKTLYFSLGGYLLSGATFWTELPFKGTIHKLAAAPNGQIEYWKNHYWLIGGEGDGCWGFTTYNLLNTRNRSVSHVTDSSVGCTDGDALIDVDKRDQIIMAFHTAGNPEDDGGSGIYRSVSLIPINNPSTKQTIITQKSMPANIISIRYLSDTDQLLLTGAEKYLYDMTTGKLEKSDIDIPEPIPTEPPHPKTVNDIVNDNTLPKGYQFVLE